MVYRFFNQARIELLDIYHQPDYIQDVAAYLRASIALALDPTPLLDHITTSQPIAPVVEQFVVTPSYLLSEFIDSLAQHRLREASDS